MKWLSLVLAGVIVVMIWLWPDSSEVNTQPWKAEISRLEAENKALESLEAKRAEKFTADSLQFIKTTETLQSKVKDQSLVIERLKANPRVIEVRRNEPQVDSLIIAQDSVIEYQMEQHFIQARYVDELHNNIAEIRMNFEERLQNEREAREAQEQLTIAAMHETKKEKRKRRIATVLIPVAAVVGFLLAK